MYKLSLSRDQAFCVTHYDQSVKTPNSCSEIGLHPLHAPDQPIKIPCGLNYPFEKILMGATRCHSLKKMIKEFLPESDFVSCREFPKVSSNAHGYILCCHRYKHVGTISKKDYSPDMYTQKESVLNPLKHKRLPGH
jgi:hypothetical protein